MTADKKTPPYASQAQVQQDSPRNSLSLLSQESPGVKRVEIISSHIHLIDRIFLFSSAFLIAYVYGLDSQVRQTYQVWAFSNVLRMNPLLIHVILQSLATANYQEHSLLATINVLRAVIAAAAQVRSI